jgi:hypothetical protein
MSSPRDLLATRSSWLQSAATAGTPSLFGLAPCGVCPARAITRAAVRSCRTFSPLPRRFTRISCRSPRACRTSGAVSFLWHFPSIGLDADFPDVIRHTALWSSDFPPSSLDATRAAVRSSCLRVDYMRWHRAEAGQMLDRILDACHRPGGVHRAECQDASFSYDLSNLLLNLSRYPGQTSLQ